jgi:hypothetical protein
MIVAKHIKENVNRSAAGAWKEQYQKMAMSLESGDRGSHIMTLP